MKEGHLGGSWLQVLRTEGDDLSIFVDGLLSQLLGLFISRKYYGLTGLYYGFLDRGGLSPQRFIKAY